MKYTMRILLYSRLNKRIIRRYFFISLLAYFCCLSLVLYDRFNPFRESEIFTTFAEREAGYGNRMYTVISALTIGLLTNRRIYIDWPELVGHIKEPFSNDSFDIPNRFWIRNRAPSFFFYSIQSVYPIGDNFWRADKNMRSIIQTSVEYWDPTIKFEQNGAYFFEVCSNPIYYDRLRSLGLVRQETISVAREAIELMNDETKNKDLIESIYPVGYETAGILLRKFWIPEDGISQQIEDFVTKNFKANLVIGLQIRTEFLLPTSDLEGFIKCAEKLEELSKSVKPIKWFITSDSADVLAELKGKYPEKVKKINK
jgi:hypothetical protein